MLLQNELSSLPCSCVLCTIYVGFQKMRLFQQNLEDLSSRISAAEAIKNSWQNPGDISEVGEMLEQLQVQPDASLMH